MSKINWDSDRRRRNVSRNGSLNDFGDPRPIAAEGYAAIRKPLPTLQKIEVKPNYLAMPLGTILQCRYCKDKVKASNMDRHLKKQHPPEMRVKKNAPIPSQKLSSHPCPVCNEKVQILKVHFLKAHGISLGPDGKPL